MTQSFSATPEQVHAFFKAHWTVRKFKSYQIPQLHLETMLFAASRAPTDATAQMSSLIRVTDLGLREKVAELSSNPHFKDASESFLVCADVARLNQILNIVEQRLASIPTIAVHFGIGDAVLAGQNLLIAAEMLGYRGCWIGGVITAVDEIAQLLNLPPGVIPFAGLTIGLPDEAPIHRPRLPRAQLVHENRYYSPSTEELKVGIRSMASITARGNWAATLARYFAVGGSMEGREGKLKSFIEQSLRSLMEKKSE